MRREAVRGGRGPGKRQAVGRLIFPAAALLVLLVSCRPERSGHLSALWALRYGTSRMPETAVFADGVPGRSVDFAWIFYALQWDGRWLLIDPGFDDPGLVKIFGIEWTDPLRLLESVGIKPADVAVVLVTHAHFDHAGLVHRFPNARVVVSEAARQDAVRRSRSPEQKVFWESSPRITTFRGTYAVGEGLVMVEVGGHAPGSSVIRLEAEKILFTGDEAYFPANWTGPRPNGTVTDTGANRVFLEKLHQEAGGLSVFTMHDPSLIPGEEKTKKFYLSPSTPD